MSVISKPFLITKGEDGEVRLTVRETRHNSSGYPWVVQTMVDQTFKNAAAARLYASEEFGAQRGDFAIK